MDGLSTILAVASPPGAALRGLIRISGAGTRDLLEHSLPLRDARAGYAARLKLETIELPVLVLAYTAPHSYTGEDVVELQMPGNPALLERVVDELIRAGDRRGLEARRAEAGEFTARAYFNGRLSLTEAEGVAEIIAARSDAELRAARELHSGALGRFAEACSDELAAALALVEAGIDFSDQEDVVAITAADLLARLTPLCRRLDDWLSRAVGSESLRALPWVVLTGPPNAGKSTLFNALLGYERAVVSPTHGTTRDVLAEPISLATDHGPAEVMLVDLAGVEDVVSTTLGAHMQEVAAAARARAELLIDCLPVEPAGAAGRPPATDPPPAPATASLLVRTKCDLAPPGFDTTELVVSARTMHNLDALHAAIADRLADRAVSLAADMVILLPRHEASLRRAAESLEAAIALAAPASGGEQLPEAELIASSLRSALDELGLIAGRLTPDDVLGHIFASFCVGK